MVKKIEVFCDFDGTATCADVFDTLLEKLADPEWQVIEEQWVNGEISSRECMALQTRLIRGGWDSVAEVLKTVVVDPSFPAFVEWCRKNEISLTLVSDGLDKVIEYVLKRDNIEIKKVWANRLEEDSDGNFSLGFPHAPQSEDCGSGLCKCQILEKAALKSNPLKIVIGDGRSDFCWAENADRVYAKSKLLKHCLEQQIECVPFESFDTIRADLEQLCSSESATALN